MSIRILIDPQIYNKYLHFMSDVKAKQSGGPSVQQMLDELEFSNIEDLNGITSEGDLELKRKDQEIHGLNERLAASQKVRNTLTQANQVLEKTNKMLRSKLARLEQSLNSGHFGSEISKGQSVKSADPAKENETSKVSVINERDFDQLKLELSQKCQEICLKDQEIANLQAQLKSQETSSPSSEDSTVTDLNETVGKLRTEIETLTTTNNNLKANISALERKNRELSHCIEKLEYESSVNQPGLLQSIDERSKISSRKQRTYDIDNMDEDIPNLAPQIVGKGLIDELSRQLEAIPEPERQVSYLNALLTWVEARIESKVQGIEDLD